MKFLSNLQKDDLKNKIVLVRSGLNVPLTKSGEIADDFRIKKALPTIEFLVKYAKRVIVIAHIGRDMNDTLIPVVKALQPYLQNYTNIDILENLRQDFRERSNDIEDRDIIAREIIEQTGADIFVQDAFSVLHREHASITSMPKFLPSYAGFLVEKEVERLTKILTPQTPSVFILGGAKFFSKEPLIRKFLNIYDKVFIGGAIANEFFESMNYEIGQSLTYNGDVPDDILYNDKIILPTIVHVLCGDGSVKSVKPKEVQKDMKIVDAFPQTDLLKLSGYDVRSVVWNGPMGYYEGGYTHGTEMVARMLSNTQAEIVIGGGDTVAAISKIDINDNIYLSAGGGAMLIYLQEGTLVGIKALE